MSDARVLDAVPPVVIERARAAAELLARARARVALGEPETGEHGHEFRKVLTPMVLYRSVSPEEWEAIQREGAILGGLNKFNPWDQRREVFFGAEPSVKLLHQGGELTRRADYALLSGGAGNHQAELDVAHARIAKVDEEMLELAQELGFTSIDEVTMRVRLSDPEWKRLKTKRQKQSERVQVIQKEARETARALMASMREKDQARGYDAVLLTTHPLAGARRYEGGHSGMGDEAEYGMDSGAVKLSDIASVRYIKDKKISDAPVLDAVQVRALLLDSLAPLARIRAASSLAAKAAKAAEYRGAAGLSALARLRLARDITLSLRGLEPAHLTGFLDRPDRGLKIIAPLDAEPDED